MDTKRMASYAISLLAIALAFIAIATFFDRLPIENTSLAIDWRGLWLGLEGGVPQYGNATGLRIPPWSLMLILPLGLTTFKASWGILTFITLIVLVLSVPKDDRKIYYWGSILLLTCSFPTLRTIADGNFEALPIAGILLILSGLTKGNSIVLVIGALLSATKVQESWMLLLLLPFFVIRRWSFQDWGKAALTIAIICIPTLIWKGEEWINAVFAIRERGSIMDSSLLATFTRTGLPTWTSIIAWAVILITSITIILKSSRSLTREKLGFMVAASLLLSPYAAGNSYLTVLAIGIIPIVLYWTPVGLVMLALINLPLLTISARDFWFQWSASYWTIMLFVSWAVFALWIKFTEGSLGERISRMLKSLRRSPES